MTEDLIHNEPSERELEKFRKINKMSEEEWERKCSSCNDCSVCFMAVHKELYSTTKHVCTYGISESKFKILMDSDSVWY